MSDHGPRTWTQPVPKPHSTYNSFMKFIWKHQVRDTSGYRFSILYDDGLWDWANQYSVCTFWKDRYKDRC